MERNSAKPSTTALSANPAADSRARSGLLRAGLAAVLLFLGLAGFLRFRSGDRPGNPAVTTEAEAGASAVSTDTPGVGSSKVADSSGANPVRTVSHAQVPAPTDVAGSSQAAREIVDRLARLNLKGGSVSLEQAEIIKKSLALLASQGAVGVPAIREFLERNQDISFADLKAADAIGTTSLRMGMLDALRQIGGPEAVAASLATLQTTADPLEVAMLARNLDEMAGGQYRQESVNAIRETLAQAARGQLSGRDVAPLFQYLGSKGDASLLADVIATNPQWNQYATMAMANIPNGEGLAYMICQMQDPGAPALYRNDFSYQMLAQYSGQYPDAANSLVEQARQGQIPDRAWSRIAMGLSGDQYLFGNAYYDPALPTNIITGRKTYYIVSGNQNFFSVPFQAWATPDQITQRLALIDQLLGATSNPAALQALQDARAALAPRPGG